jgi:oligopeptide transport system permease protein
MSKKLAFYILKRVLLSILTIFLVILITFFVMHAIPGGPFLSEKSPSPEVTKALQAKYGLDKPVMEQFWTYLKGVVKFDFGPSIKQRGRSVTSIIMEGFAVSAKLGLVACALAIIIGLVLGSLAAVFHNKAIDKITMVLSTAFVAMPSFIIATFLLLIFCVKLNLLPANGSSSGGLILPIISLALYPMAYIIRLPAQVCWMFWGRIISAPQERKAYALTRFCLNTRFEMRLHRSSLMPVR